MILELTPAERAIGAARRFGIDALHAAAALDIVAPIPGRTWYPVCCWCLDRVEHDAPDECVHRISKLAWQSAGGCGFCPYAGPDTLVVALRPESVNTGSHCDRELPLTLCP